MSKVSELDLAIKDLRSAAATINDVANSLAEMFSNPAPEEPVTPEAPKVTFETVRAILADKSRNGFTAQIRTLLEKYGASKLSQLDPAHYQAVLAEVEVLGDGN